MGEGGGDEYESGHLEHETVKRKKMLLETV
jgi:hypothetical protein